MPADLTREEIDAMQDRLAVDGDPTHDDMWVLLDYARSEPTRLAAARQEERERCIKVVRDHIMAVRLGEADGDFRSIASAIEHHIRALAPPPAEPSTTRLGHTDLMVSPEAIEEVLATEPSAPVAKDE